LADRDVAYERYREKCDQKFFHEIQFSILTLVSCGLCDLRMAGECGAVVGRFGETPIR
jgi:hypothetical protein